MKEKASPCLPSLWASVLCLYPQDQLAEGLHMIDFEQLKINNVDLNEKIEERNEDIIKLKQKVTSTVQVLTHIKEKLHFLEVRLKLLSPPCK